MRWHAGTTKYAAAALLVVGIAASHGWCQSYLTEGYELPLSSDGAGILSDAPSPEAAPLQARGDYEETSGGLWSPGSAGTTSRYNGTPERRTFETANLIVDLPGGPWREMPTPAGVAGAVVVLTQQDPEIGVIVAGEKLGVELTLSPEILLKASQRVATEHWPGMRFENQQPLLVNGIAGTRFEGRDDSQGVPIYSVIWSAQQNGYLYHVLAFGEANQTGAVEAAHRLFRDRISRIDAARIAHADQNVLVGIHESATFGYRVDLTNLGWIKSSPTSEKLPGTDFSAARADLGLMILPTPLPGRVVDVEILSKIYLKRLGFEYPSAEIQSVGPCRMGTFEGQEFRGQRTTPNGRIDYHLRVVSDSTAAYLIMGVTVDGDDAARVQINQVLERVTLLSGPVANAPPATVEINTAWGLMLNEIGLHLYQRGDLAGALDFFAYAYKLHPSDRAILSNHVDTLQELGRTAEALTILQQHQSKYRGDQNVEALQAKLLGANGRSDEARRIYTQLFARGYVEETALANYIDLAVEAKAYEEAIAAVRQFALRRPTIDVQLTLATLYSEKGDHDTAIAQLQSLSAQNPNNLDVSLRLSRIYGDAEHYKEALAITQKLLDSGQRDEVVWLLHGKNLLNAEQYAEAKRTFEQAAEQYPHSEIAKELVKAAANQLGQGDNSALTTPIAPVDIPPAVRTAIQRAPLQAAKSLEKYGAEEQVRIVGVSYHRGRPLKTTVCRRIKIHTEGGVSQYRTLTFEFNPTAEQFYVNRLVVLDAAGKQVAEGSVDTYYVVDDSSTGVASNAKVVTVPVPGLKAGHTIECMVTREELSPSDEFGFDEVVLSTSVPVSVSAYYISGEVKNLKYKTSVPLSVESTDDLLYCVAANPAPYREEVKQQPIERFLPIVWVGEAGSTWPAESQKYLKMVAGQTRARRRDAKAGPGIDARVQDKP